MDTRTNKIYEPRGSMATARGSIRNKRRRKNVVEERGGTRNLYLCCKLSGGREDECSWLGDAIERAPVSPSVPVPAPSSRRRHHQAAHDGEAERGRLPGPGLRARHEVPPGHDDRHGVALHGRGVVVAAARHVPEHGLRQPGRLEPVGGGRRALPAHLHRDVVLVQPPLPVAADLEPVHRLGEHAHPGHAVAASATATVRRHWWALQLPPH